VHVVHGLLVLDGDGYLKWSRMGKALPGVQDGPSFDVQSQQLAE
jgi:hypothetical protein